MKLEKPLTEDISKLHSQITNITHQAFLLTTSAITIFGVFVAFLIPKDTLQSGDPVKNHIVVFSILLLFLLNILYLMVHYNNRLLRIFTTYLLVCGSSNWETAWYQYCKKPFWGYLKVVSMVFTILGITSVILPYVFIVAYELKFNVTNLVIFLIFYGAVFLFQVHVIGFLNWWNGEDNAKNRWESLCNEK